jgi:hypothetical protein
MPVGQVANFRWLACKVDLNPVRSRYRVRDYVATFRLKVGLESYAQIYFQRVRTHGKKRWESLRKEAAKTRDSEICRFERVGLSYALVHGNFSHVLDVSKASVPLARGDNNGKQN